MAIANRYEFMYYIACTNANPNGDPDMGNMPRVDPQTMRGYITDGATKRRIRNYIDMAYHDQPGMNIIIQQSTSINRHIAEAKRAAGVEDCVKSKDAIYAGRRKACEMFYDVRTFGAVMSTGPNAGQVRGFISANLAAETGFDDADLKALFEAILNMYEHDHSASKGEMAVVSPLIIFKHVGTDMNSRQRARQARLGCAPAHRLFDLVHVSRKDGVAYAWSWRDYDAVVQLDKVPAGVQIGFQRDAFSGITGDELPADDEWFRRGSVGSHSPLTPDACGLLHAPGRSADQRAALGGKRRHSQEPSGARPCAYAGTGKARQ